MDDFSKYFKNMIDNLMKGVNPKDLNFDIKAFDMSSGGQIPFMNMFLGNISTPKRRKRDGGAAHLLETRQTG